MAYRWFLFRAKPLRDEAGQVTKWFGTNTDIDQRKRAEDAFRVVPTVALKNLLTLKCTSGLILVEDEPVFRFTQRQTVPRACESCTERGSPVQLQTVKALLTEVALRRVRLTHYRFCANPECETVYFGDAGDGFQTGDIRVPVRQKQRGDGRLLCYCFGETESGIQSELLEHGRTDVVARIREHISARRCACDIRNPRGACCLVM